MNSTINEDICRLCANHGNNYHSIFDTNSIVEKIHNCLPIVINSKDKLPSHICNPCLEALNISHKLRTQCLQADSIFRKQLQVVLIQNIKLEDEPIDIKTERDADVEEFNEDINDSDWACEFCQDVFKSSDDLLAHKNEVHSNEAVYINKTYIDDNSEDCDGSVVAEDPLDIKDENIVTNSANESVVDPDDDSHCNICGVTIDDKKLMELHVHFHKPRPLSCCYCYQVLPTPYNLYLHKQTAHRLFINEQIKWFCEKCQKLTASPECIQKHRRQCSKVKYNCQYCPEEFVYKREFIAHQKKSHYDIIIKDPQFEKFKCDICDKSYLDHTTYKRHLQMHQAIKNETYKCTYCDKVCSSRFNLQDHIQSIHNRRQQFECDVCGKAFWNQNHLKIHKRKHNKFICNQCGEQFQSFNILDQHSLDVHNSRAPNRAQYSCKECGLSFKKVRLLQDHQNLHTGEQPYTCKDCSKTFRTYSAHWAHSQMHKQSGFYCDYCQQKFINKRNLRKHIPTHQSPEDWHYYCEMCDIKFANDARLQRHWEKYAQTHVRTCHICGLELLGVQRLKRHLNLKHDIWEKNECSEVEKK